MQSKEKAEVGLTNCKVGEKVRKGAFACSVEKYRNSRPSPKALCINSVDQLEKKFEKVPAQNHPL